MIYFSQGSRQFHYVLIYRNERELVYGFTFKVKILESDIYNILHLIKVIIYTFPV